MEFDKIHQVSRIQLEVLLVSRLIMILICIQYVFSPCRIIIKETTNKSLSLLKVTHYLIRNPDKIIKIITELIVEHNKPGKAINALARYCSYDKRKRINYEDEMDDLFSLS